MLGSILADVSPPLLLLFLSTLVPTGNIYAIFGSHLCRTLSPLLLLFMPTLVPPPANVT